MTRFRRPLAAILTLSCTFALAANAAGAKEPDQSDAARPLWVYVGTYTWKTSKGIYLCHLDTATGKLELTGLAAETVNPSFVVRHPTRPLLYAIGEIDRLAGKPRSRPSPSSRRRAN